MNKSQILSNIIIAFILLFVTSACSNTKNETENISPSNTTTITSSINQEESSIVGVWEAIPDTSFIDDLRKEYPEAKEEELLRLREGMTSIETKQKLSFQEGSYCEWTGLTFGGKGNYAVSELSDTVIMMLKCKNRNGRLSTENIAYRINSDNTITKIDYVYGDTIITHFQKISNQFEHILTDDLAQSVEEFMEQNNLDYIDPKTGKTIDRNDIDKWRKSEQSSNTTSNQNSFGEKLMKANELAAQMKKEIQEKRNANATQKAQTQSNNIAPTLSNSKNTSNRIYNKTIQGNWIIINVRSKDGYDSGEINLLRELEVGTKYQFRANGHYQKIRINNSISTGKYTYNENNLVIQKDQTSSNYQLTEQSNDKMTLHDIEHDVLYVFKKE